MALAPWRHLSLSQSFCASAVSPSAGHCAPGPRLPGLCLPADHCALRHQQPLCPGAPLPPTCLVAMARPTRQTATGAEGWRQLLGLLPEHVAEKLREAWAFGQSHQMGVVALGLLTCLLAMLLAGRLQVREAGTRSGRSSAEAGPWGHTSSSPPQAPHLSWAMVTWLTGCNACLCRCQTLYRTASPPSPQL